MSFAVSDLNSANFLDSAKLSINAFTRKYPLVSIISALALSILAFSTLSVGSFTGLFIGSVFAFSAFTIANHIISHREEFLSLIKYSIMSLRASSYEERLEIELDAQIVRDRIAKRG